MADRVAGIHYQGSTLPEMVAMIRRADQAGVLSVWLTAGGLGADSLTTLAVAGTQTEQIQLGTSIVVTYSRHPVAMIQQAVAISEVAPGRFRLGIGPSHRPMIEGTYGLPLSRPLEQVRLLRMRVQHQHQVRRTGQIELKFITDSDVHG